MKDEVQAARKKKNRKEGIVKAAAIILALLVLVSVAAYRFNDVTWSGLNDYVSGILSGAGKGEGYPFSLGSAEVLDVGLIGGEAALLTDKNVTVLDSTARKRSVINHAFSTPMMKQNSGRLLLLDVGGTAYRLQSKTKLLYEGKTETKILTGAVGKNGNYALALRGESSTSKLLVYNSRQKLLFEWACAKEHIIAVDLSDNGRQAVVSVIGAQNGAPYTRVLVFDFDYNEPLGTYEYPDSVISNVSFLNGKSILLYGSSDMHFIAKDGTKTDVDLSINKLSRVFTDDGNMTAAILSKYGSVSDKLLCVYDKNGEKLFETAVDRAVRDVSCDGTYITVLTQNSILNYNRKGELISETEVGADALKCYTDGRRVFVWENGEIGLYSAVQTEKK